MPTRNQVAKAALTIIEIQDHISRLAKAVRNWSLGRAPLEIDEEAALLTLTLETLRQIVREDEREGNSEFRDEGVSSQGE